MEDVLDKNVGLNCLIDSPNILTYNTPQPISTIGFMSNTEAKALTTQQKKSNREVELENRVAELEDRVAYLEGTHSTSEAQQQRRIELNKIAQFLEDKYGFNLDRIHREVYPEMPYSTPWAANKNGITKYHPTRQHQLIRNGIIPKEHTFTIGSQIIMDPIAIQHLKEYEDLKAAEPHRGPKAGAQYKRRRRVA